jgi:alpha-amylase/alpha-mannosidase (GH57 family)
MKRYVCIHGHFYQPPRENPWLEAIEQQDSAYPYHDWNERITAECYAPNAHARILDGRQRITRISSNYGRISFNFGPTLLAWLEDNAPETYAAVLDADRESAARFDGHGSALAQAYNHSILPLATDRDRRTQVVWGLRDFERRFGRPAAGLWLPETAVDTPTLEVLAACGVRFTILAPHQAAAVRALDATEWSDVAGGRVDPTVPYRCSLPSGRHIDLFFYDGPVSQGVAFEGLLGNGERFANRLLGLLHDQHGARLAHIATDGETYGHHHRHGDMALAYALHYLETVDGVELTNYGAFLERHPPRHEVRIVERSSWSCVHGVERWRSDCGCHTGSRPGWTQAWRAPLREAFDALTAELGPLFEAEAAALVEDPWAARDDYIDVILDRGPDSLHAFLGRHARRPLDAAATTRLLKLLEMQRHTMLMYTSCGWFFNDVSGIETVQVLRYAGRAVQLAEDVSGRPFEPALLRRLESARSNLAEYENARRIWDRYVQPARVDLMAVAAHYAVSSLFDSAAPATRVYCYDVELVHAEERRHAEASLSVGQVRVRSRLTLEADTLTYAVLHFGNHNFSGGIRRFAGSAGYRALATAMVDTFEQGDLESIVTLLAQFPEYTFSLRSLFADRQREILHRLLDAQVTAAERAFRAVYEGNVDLMRYLIDLDLPLPRAFTLAAEFVLNRDLRRALDAPGLDLQRARTLLEQARATRVPLDQDGLAFAIARSLERLVERALAEPGRVEALERIADLATLARSLAFEVDLWKAQNLFYTLIHGVYPEWRRRAADGDAAAARWADLCTTVGEQLAVAVE